MLQEPLPEEGIQAVLDYASSGPRGTRVFEFQARLDCICGCSLQSGLLLLLQGCILGGATASAACRLMR